MQMKVRRGREVSPDLSIGGGWGNTGHCEGWKLLLGCEGGRRYRGTAVTVGTASESVSTCGVERQLCTREHAIVCLAPWHVEKGRQIDS